MTQEGLMVDNHSPSEGIPCSYGTWRFVIKSTKTNH